MAKLRDQVLDLMEIRRLEMTRGWRAVRNWAAFGALLAMAVASGFVGEVSPAAGYVPLALVVAIVPFLLGRFVGRRQQRGAARGG